MANTLILLATLPIFAQPPATTPPVIRRAPPNNGLIINSQTLPQSILAPDPFDSMISSAASFDIDSPIETRAEFDPPTVPVGGHVVYRIVLTVLDESLTVPEKIPAPDGLDLHPGGRGQTYQFTGGTKLRPLTTVIYRATITNTNPGTITIPEFNVTAYGKPVKIPAATLNVVPVGAMPGREGLRLLLQLPQGDYYVGQLLRIPVALPVPGGPGIGVPFLTFTRTHITGDFIFSEQFFQGSRIETVQQDGKNVQAFTQDVLITPLREGKQELIAQANAQNSILVDSEPVTIDVKPLPSEGRLPGFTGAVGSFQTEPPVPSSEEIHAGEPFNLTVRIRGDGNLGRLLPPQLPALREWQNFPPEPDMSPASLVQQRGFASFTYTLIPLSEKITATPVIPFSYFDPRQKAYVAMNIPAAPIKVLPGANGATASSPPPLEKPPVDLEHADVEKEPTFSGLMDKPGIAVASLVPLQQRWWFAALQLIPAGLIGGLWAWDRRRRFLEQHPQVILKRRARRGLRRELRLARRAAAARDAAGFVTGAANALREACAPHIAAHPAALVYADVLQELPEPRRNGPTAEMVRRLFTAADALRFGGKADGGDLLAHQEEVEQVLEELRERL